MQRHSPFFSLFGVGILLFLLIAGVGCMQNLPSSGQTAADSAPAAGTGDTSQSQGGISAPATGSGSCPSGHLNCGGICRNVATDAANCGACNTVCPTGWSCTGGQCGIACPQGKTGCGNLCTDTSTDTKNCGSCGAVCAQGQSCTKGKCATACTGSQVSCNGICRDTSTDPLNCGSCGVVCAVGESCSSGRCGGGAGPAIHSSGQGSSESCGTGGTMCGSLCTNLKVDPWNCGQCNNRCPSSTACVNGVCQATSCSDNRWSCSGTCVSLSGEWPPLNCGGCGQACPSGNVCAYGICTPFSCPTGSHVCQDYTCCPAGTDDPCASLGGTFCNYQCCKPGETCSDGACVAQSGSSSSTVDAKTCLMLGKAYCSGACVDTKTDAANCGGCGNTCTASGSACCNGICVNLLTDSGNCGACGASCGSTKLCSNGACSLSKCATIGKTECGGSCVDLMTDPGNCGACGSVCTSPSSCIDGTCLLNKCATIGKTECGGSCVDLATDNNNCGTCGHSCGQFMLCSGGVCVQPGGGWVRT